MDKGAIDRRGLDESTVNKLTEAYRMGWLHNVLSRITPLTMRRRDDYLNMADLFIDTPEAAHKLLDRFDADLEMFCSVAEIQVTEHMTSKTVSDELKAHVELYNDIAGVLYGKFKGDVEKRDPIQSLAMTPITTDSTNPFIAEFMKEKFPKKN